MQKRTRSSLRRLIQGYVLTAGAVAVVFVPMGAAAASKHPLEPYIELAQSSLRAIAAAHDYEALFTKRELVGRTRYDNEMAIKFRQNPFSVYLRFYGPNEGREVIYVAGANRGQLLAHEPPGTLKGMVGTVHLNPMDSQAMAEGRHPITEIGMQKMVETLIGQWQREMKAGIANDPKVEFFPDASLADTKCKVARTTHLSPGPNVRFYQTLLYIDKKTNFPVRVEQWGFPDPVRQKPYLIEEYTYGNIKTNVGLTNFDFDVRNRAYRF